MILVELFLSFLRIGLFSFGGGMAMIPMYLAEVERHGWLSRSEFMDIVAISQMTPGPIAINMATYVGSRLAGWPGAVTASLALALPSVLIIIILSSCLGRLNNNPWKQAFVFGIQSAAMALVFYAGYLLIRNALSGTTPPHAVIGLGIFISGWLIRHYRPQIPPPLVLLAAGMAGVLLF